MKVVLLDRSEKQIGRLIPDLVTPREIEDLDGELRLLFDYPLNAERAEEIITGNYVAIQDLDNNWQLYEIRETSADKDIIHVDCEHAYYALGKMEYVDLTLSSVTAQQALSQVLSGTGWQPGTIQLTGTRSPSLHHINPLQAIDRLASLWECEIRYRVTLSGTGIQAKYVDMLIRRGSFTGKRCEFGKDLEDIRIVTDKSNVVTALYGWGQGQDLDEDGNAERITIADVEWVKGEPAELYPGGPTSPAPVSKPLGQLWVGDDDARLEHGRLDTSTGQPVHIFDEYGESQAQSPESLIWETWRQLQQRTEPLVNIQATVAALEQVPGFEHEKVRLGDTCYVVVPDIAPLEARVIRIDRQRKSPQNTRIELGNFRPAQTNKLRDIERSQRRADSRSAIWDRAKAFDPSGKLTTSVLDGVIDAATNQLLAGGGTFRADGDGAWILDTGDPDTALGAVRMVSHEGEAAILIAKRNSPIDPWDVRVGMTSEGFRVFGDEIIGGRVLANYIQIGGATEFQQDFDPSQKATPYDVAAAEYEAKAHAEAKASDAEAAAKTYAEQQAEAAYGAAAGLMEALADGTYQGGGFIDGTTIYSPNVVGLNVLGASGEFNNLMAGQSNGARLEMGQSSGNPFLRMRDSNELRVDFKRDRIEFHRGGILGGEIFADTWTGNMRRLYLAAPNNINLIADQGSAGSGGINIFSSAVASEVSLFANPSGGVATHLAVRPGEVYTGGVLYLDGGSAQNASLVVGDGSNGSIRARHIQGKNTSDNDWGEIFINAYTNEDVHLASGGGLVRVRGSGLLATGNIRAEGGFRASRSGVMRTGISVTMTTWQYRDGAERWVDLFFAGGILYSIVNAT